MYVCICFDKRESILVRQLLVKVQTKVVTFSTVPQQFNCIPLNHTFVSHFLIENNVNTIIFIPFN